MTNILDPLTDFFLVLTGRIFTVESKCIVATVILPMVGLCLSSVVERQPTHVSGVGGLFFCELGHMSFRARSYKSTIKKPESKLLYSHRSIEQ